MQTIAQPELYRSIFQTQTSQQPTCTLERRALSIRSNDPRDLTLSHQPGRESTMIGADIGNGSALGDLASNRGKTGSQFARHPLRSELSGICETTGDGACCSNRRGDQVDGARRTHSPIEISIRGASRDLSGQRNPGPVSDTAATPRWTHDRTELAEERKDSLFFSTLGNRSGRGSHGDPYAFSESMTSKNIGRSSQIRK